MNIKLDRIVKNKTFFYLAPILRYYNTEFITYFNTNFKLGIGIMDYKHKDSILFKNKRLLFTVFNAQYKSPLFTNYLNWIRYHESYVYDYSYSILGNLHMIVFKIPKRFNSAYDNFILGNYSKMYNIKELKQIFPIQQLKKNKEQLDAFAVITKSYSQRRKFVKQLREIYGTNISSEAELLKNMSKDTEVSLPPIIKDEVFNVDEKEVGTRFLRQEFIIEKKVENGKI